MKKTLLFVVVALIEAPAVIGKVGVRIYGYNFDSI